MVLERPATQVRVYRSPTVGDNAGGGISAMRLQGARIRGVVVDNPSGSWVMLDGVGLAARQFIPPYTLGWSGSPLPSVDELSAAYVVGPTGQPIVVIGAPITVYVSETQVASSPGATFSPAAATTRADAADAHGQSLPGAGIIATITFAAVAGARLTPAYINASLSQVAGVGSDIGLFVWDGASGSTLIWAVKLAVTGVAGSSDHFNVLNIPVAGGIGNQMVIEFQAAVAGVIEWLSAGVYYVRN